MLLLYVKQSIQLIFAVFTVEITNDTSMCRPVDTTVYFLNSPISFSVASDSTGLLEGGEEMLKRIQSEWLIDVFSCWWLDIIVSFY